MVEHTKLAIISDIHANKYALEGFLNGMNGNSGVVREEVLEALEIVK